TRERGVLVAERERGLVPVVTIRDQQLLVGHQLLDALGSSRPPEPMSGAVLVADFGERRRVRALVEQLIDLALRIRIKHEELTVVGVRVSQEFEAVFLWSG